ncbi:MAG: aspartyl protease family protein [Candidatus Hodarchaeales archaeon]|jgi:predicted aspartyl protease
MEIGFDISGGLVQIPVTINKRGPFKFHLDTGAKMTTISESFSEFLEISTNMNKFDEVTTRNGIIKLMIGTASSLSIGSETIAPHEIRIHNTPLLLGSRIKGVIGHNTLQNYILQVNYPERIVTLQKDQQQDSLDDFIDFEYVDSYHHKHLVTLDVFINKKGPFPFIVDTGAGGTVLNSQLAEELHLALIDSSIKCVGPSGEANAQITVIDEFNSHFITKYNLQILVLPLSHLCSNPKKILGGIIGYNLLKRTKLFINYPEKKIEIQ